MLLLNFILAMLPILWLMTALTKLKMEGYKACLITLLLSCILSLFFWDFGPALLATASLEGLLNGLWPICLVIIAALFTYNLTVKTGAMEQINRMLSGVSTDQRVMMLLIAWGFGNFMEGMAGFGTSVAIPASMLASMGINPIRAAVACIVATSTLTAFGSVGIPLTTLSAITGIDVISLCSDVVLMQCILTFISPYIMLCIFSGSIRGLKGVMALTTVSALSFTVPWYISAGILGSELPDIIGAICCMVCTIIASRLLPVSGHEGHGKKGEEPAGSKLSAAEALKAWSPFLLIFVLLMGTSKLCPPVYNAISGIKTSLVIFAGENPNTLTFSWINTPGVIIIFAAIIGGLIQGLGGREILSVFVHTLKKYWKTVVTICAIMATAKIMSYSGMISDIASMLVVAAGSFYPFIAPILGALGGFVTGSGTTTAVLFGGLQMQTATSLGLNPSWIAAANEVGAGIGKMIAPQTLAIAAGAIDVAGSESGILRATFKYFLFYMIGAGVLCMTGSLIG
ncbi:MAG: lactate permease LctP family transporter [Firmicutes bacterium]|nr:lactate permease LctP family transporter [Bacillota bacterium]